MFSYRGFMLDSVRHMQTIEEIKKLIDAIALLGFNKFHWHLTDDQGWRFESKCFPLLNTVSATRPYSGFGKVRIDEPYGRVYSREEIAEIVSYCSGKGIDVVPEFDIPGHTSALLSAYPHLSCDGGAVDIKTQQGIFKDVLCIGKEETFEMVVQIVDEFLEVFPGEYIHIGGDETPSDHWENCPCCQQYMKEHNIKTYPEYQNAFMNRIIDHLESKGRRAIVWNDATRGTNLDKRAIVQYWKEKPKPTVRFIKEGGKVILSPFSYCYLDYGYNITPLNKVYSMKPTLPGITEKEKNNIIGIEAPIWTEYITENEKLEKFIFPRLVAVSKIASGEERKPYKEFLQDVKKFRDEQSSLSFMQEDLWTKPKLSMIGGWLKFVKDNYSLDFIIDNIKEMI